MLPRARDERRRDDDERPKRYLGYHGERARRGKVDEAANHTGTNLVVGCAVTATSANSFQV